MRNTQIFTSAFLLEFQPISHINKELVATPSPSRRFLLLWRYVAFSFTAYSEDKACEQTATYPLGSVLGLRGAVLVAGEGAAGLAPVRSF